LDGQAGYPRQWSLVPGYDYVPQDADTDNDGVINVGTAPKKITNASVFIVGRAVGDVANVREGTTQEVTAYVTFVNVR
jgi:hypothetical protein